MFFPRLFLFFVFEWWNCIYDVFYFFRRLQRLTIFVKWWLFFSIFIAIFIWLIRTLWLLPIELLVILLLLASVTRRVLEVLLLLWIWSLIIGLPIVISIEVYLDSWTLSLYIIKHVLNIIHDTGKIEEIVWLTTWLYLWTHTVWYLLSLCSTPRLLLLLHTWYRYVCHSWNSIHKLHHIWVIGVCTIYIWIRILLMTILIICWYSLISVPLLSVLGLLSWIYSVWTSLILLLHTVYLASGLICIYSNWNGWIMLLMQTMTRMGVLLAELLVHHFKLCVNLFYFIITEKSFFLIGCGSLNLFLNIFVFVILVIWILSAISSLLILWTLSGIVFDIVFILIFDIICLPYVSVFINYFVLIIRAVFVLPVHANDLSLILLNPLIIIWIIILIFPFFIFRFILPIIFIIFILDMRINSLNILMNILWLGVLLSLLLGLWLSLLLLLTWSLLLLTWSLAIVRSL